MTHLVPCATAADRDSGALSQFPSLELIASESSDGRRSHSLVGSERRQSCVPRII